MYINSVFMMYMKKALHKLFKQELSRRAGTLIYILIEGQEKFMLGYSGDQCTYMNLLVYRMDLIVRKPDFVSCKDQRC